MSNKLELMWYGKEKRTHSFTDNEHNKIAT